MNRFTLVLLCLMLILIISGWMWFKGGLASYDHLSPSEETVVAMDSSNGLAGQLIIREPSVLGRQVYISQNWRFSFEYPEGWEVREPAFKSGVSLFNLAVWPDKHDVFDPITINITPKWWGDRLKRKFESTIIIDGQHGWKYSSITMSTIPTTEYFIFLHNEYWINISIQKEHVQELQMVIDTFKFNNPPKLDALGIEIELPNSVVES